MGHSNSKITAPVSLHGDVYPVLGVSKTGTYYDTGYICSNAHGKINPFAKYKPTRYDNPNGGTAWWRANDGNCGFAGINQSTYSDIIARYHAGNTWVYQPPRPGTDWCRLADFEGYDHSAVPFLRSGIKDGSIKYVYKLANPVVHVSFFSNESSGNLHLDDFANSHTVGSRLAEGRVAAIIFDTTVLPSSPGTSLYQVQLGDKIAGTFNPGIDLDFSGYVNTGAHVVWAIGFKTTNDMFLALPQCDAENAWHTQFNIVSSAAMTASLNIQRIGFVNSSGVSNPLAYPDTYTASNPLRVTERGVLTVEVLISANEGQQYTINNPDDLQLGVSNYGSRRYLGTPRITSINGQPYSGGNYTLTGGQHVTVTLTTFSSDLVWPYDLTTGWHDLYLFDTRFSTVQDPMHTVNIYMQMNN